MFKTTLNDSSVTEQQQTDAHAGQRSQTSEKNEIIDFKNASEYIKGHIFEEI